MIDKKLLELKPEYANNKLAQSLRRASEYVLNHPGTSSSRLIAAVLMSLYNDYPAKLNSCIGFLNDEYIEWLIDSMQAVYIHKIEPHEFFKDNHSLFVELAKHLPKSSDDDENKE